MVQSIPYRPQRDVFDWDHIFPDAKAGLMWSPGPEGRWRRHHPHRHLVGSAGNFWGLHAGANRAAQDLLPEAKFAKVWVFERGHDGTLHGGRKVDLSGRACISVAPAVRLASKEQVPNLLQE